MSSMTGIIEAPAAPPIAELMPDMPVRGTASPRISPAAGSVIAVWATCLLLALSYPQALASWLDDFEPNPVVDAAQSCVARLVTLSQALGIARVSSTARELGRSLTHRPE